MSGITPDKLTTYNFEVMALQVQPTPTLEGEEAAEFLRRMGEGETASPPEAPTFNPEKALERIREVFGQPEE